jgi:hypothetical protein
LHPFLHPRSLFFLATAKTTVLTPLYVKANLLGVKNEKTHIPILPAILFAFPQFVRLLECKKTYAYSKVVLGDLRF